MFQEERHQRIVDIVNLRKTVRVSELSEELDISEVTVRRDLDELQRRKLLIRTHGGAMSSHSVGKAILYDELVNRNEDLKKSIARVGYEYIDEHDTILIDNSSTVTELIKCIVEGDKRNIRVITTSIAAIQLLVDCDKATVQVVAGLINYPHKSIEGSVSCRNIRELRVDKCFFGVNGVSDGFGFSTPRYEDADIKNTMLEVANCGILLCDHTKLGNSYLAHVKNPDYFITDTRVAGFPYDKLGNELEMVFADEYFKK